MSGIDRKKLPNFVLGAFLSRVLDEMFIKVPLFKEAFLALTNPRVHAYLVTLYDEVCLAAWVHKIKVLVGKYLPGYFKENLATLLNAHYKNVEFVLYRYRS